MAIFAVLLLIAGGILAAAALAVRFAGNAAVLAGVDLSNVRDMAMLNRWAGNRLLVLPLVALGFDSAGLSRPAIGLANPLPRWHHSRDLRAAGFPRQAGRPGVAAAGEPTRYHGVFAPNNRDRARVTPTRRGRGSQPVAVPEEAHDRTPAEQHAAMHWVQRLKRVFKPASCCS